MLTILFCCRKQWERDNTLIFWELLLPPIWPGFDSQTRHLMWIEFVGSLLQEVLPWVLSDWVSFSSKTSLQFDIGKTMRNVQVQIQEHSNACNDSEPAIHLHKNPSHSFSWRNILCTTQSFHKRRISEGLMIQQWKPALNKQTFATKRNPSHQELPDRHKCRRCVNFMLECLEYITYCSVFA